MFFCFGGSKFIKETPSSQEGLKQGPAKELPHTIILFKMQATFQPFGFLKAETINMFFQRALKKRNN